MEHLIVVSDLHINSTVALAPPGIALDDGGTYHASKEQHWLWRCWNDFIDQCRGLAGRKIVIFNGDLAELDAKKRSVQLISFNKATIQKLALETISPLVDIADGVIVLRGTAAHVGKSAWIEEAIANDLEHTIRHSPEIASWQHFRGVADGVRLDIAHHASMGSLPWTRANAANSLAAKILQLYAARIKQPAPDIALRSHNHLKADSYDNFPTRVIFTPCWTLATEFSYRVGRENDVADIGGTIIHCDGGNYSVEKVDYPLETKRIWTMKI